MRTLTVVTFMAFAGAAQANQPDITDLVTDTIGYVNIRPDVVLMEGEELGTHICRFDASDSAFDTFADLGQLPAGSVGYTCIPLEEFEK